MMPVVRLLMRLNRAKTRCEIDVVLADMERFIHTMNNAITNTTARDAMSWNYRRGQLFRIIVRMRALHSV